MKKILYILIAGVVLLTGCESYLDKIEESTGMTEEDVFTDYLNFRRFEDQMYSDMINYLAEYDYTFIAAMCDEGYLTSDWETMPIAQSGDWLRSYNTGQALQFYQVWGAWESIRIANISLKNIGMLENASQAQKNQLKGQAHFMRAWYYFEFLKRQGGMPYITKPFKGTDNFALQRLSYNETAEKIAADCDTAMTLLPDEWDMANIGRPTTGAAMALKATALLFSASPTNNPSNVVARWEAAAEASWDLIAVAEATGRYKLLECSGTEEVRYMANGVEQTINYPSGYDSIFMYQPFNDEIIWEYYSMANSGAKYLPFTVASIDAGGVIQGYGPSQNHVEMYETVNGLAIEDDPAYDSQDPWVDRDPRFYNNILFNGERWTSKTDYYLELFNGGNDRQPLQHFTVTGYLARKFWGKNLDQWSSNSPPFTHTIYFRYADLLLQYAEAANEIGGPTYAIPGASMTAVEAVNKVRNRVGMPDVNAAYLTSKEVFRERIKNERAIELYLEGKRFFDLGRWHDAHKPEHKNIYAADFAANAGAPTGFDISKSSQPVFTLTFEEKHYRWPIPLEDAIMFKEFAQNPGW